MKLKGNRTRPTFDILDLKNEYRSAFFLIVSINILLLLINVIDINWLWFNFKFDPSMNLSKYVHEGTYLLILSILLSIGLLLYFFRKNLNFYRKNEVLKIAASIWIFQNLILVISVAIRNYRYIHHFGLAYKRIGVIVFLIATVIGLITLFIKIDKRKSSYYLLNINSWCVYALLIIMSTINWDNVIVKHNIEYTNQRNLDVEFLLTLSDKTLPVIYENRSLIKDKVGFGNYRAMIAEEYLESRIRKFKWRMNHTNWRSWNYADAQAFKRLKILEK